MEKRSEIEKISCLTDGGRTQYYKKGGKYYIYWGGSIDFTNYPSEIKEITKEEFKQYVKENSIVHKAHVSRSSGRYYWAQTASGDVIEWSVPNIGWSPAGKQKSTDTWEEVLAIEDIIIDF